MMRLNTKLLYLRRLVKEAQDRRAKISKIRKKQVRPLVCIINNGNNPKKRYVTILIGSVKAKNHIARFGMER